MGAEEVNRIMIMMVVVTMMMMIIIIMVMITITIMKEIKSKGITGGGGSKQTRTEDLGFTQDDIAKWNQYSVKIDEFFETLKQLQIDFTILDGSKLKSDVSKLTKAQETFVTKTSIESMTKDVAKIKTDRQFEVISNISVVFTAPPAPIPPLTTTIFFPSNVNVPHV